MPDFTQIPAHLAPALFAPAGHPGPARSSPYVAQNSLRRSSFLSRLRKSSP